MLAFTSEPVDLWLAAVLALMLAVTWWRCMRAPRVRDPWIEAAKTERARMSGAGRRARRKQRWAWLRH